MNGRIETDVLIVGSGPAGGVVGALPRRRYGVDTIVITKYRLDGEHAARAHHQPAHDGDLPRPRRRAGRDRRGGTPHELMGDTVFCTSLAGEELGRLHTWGTHPGAAGRLHAREPVAALRHPADAARADPRRARRRARHARSASTPSTSRYEQDDDGVTATVRDRLSGATYEIRAKYLIGADGGRSKVAEQHRPAVRGPDGRRRHDEHRLRGRPLDATSRTGRASSTGCCSPGSDVGGIGMGLVRMVRPWNEWLIVWGYDIDEPPPEVDDELATRDRAQADRRRHDPDRDPLDLAVDGNNDVRDALLARAACSAWATPCTATRRRTASARTRRSRTPTTSPGSSRSC